MNRWQSRPIEERIGIINNVAFKTGISPNAIEKDWWVTMVLKALFETASKDFLTLKGGTSLGKMNLINRFSEDIDIAIDRSFFNMNGELTKKERTKLRKLSCAFIKNDLSVELSERLKEMGIEGFMVIVPESTISDADPQELYISYSSMFPEIEYIKSQVIIELSCRSMWDPFEKVNIQSIIAETYPDMEYCDDLFYIQIVSPKRTFLEKAFLLHEEFKLNRTKGSRMSRHLYDLEKLMDTEFAKHALSDTELYVAIVKHRVAFNKWKDVNYREHHASTLNFIPPQKVAKEWENDYNYMRSLFIYEESLTYQQLIDRLNILIERFRKIKLTDEFFNSSN